MNAKITAAEAKNCLCGCGQTVSAKASYRSGHDAAHCSMLLQGLVNEVADGRPITKALIAQEAKNLPSAPLQAKFRNAAERLMAKVAADEAKAVKKMEANA
ncbi:hypothetical protein [Microbacterium rhizomatis]|uniref:Uncharacterized protein n=1 Tax=Microbacterium rhizomatis TaxID=1631477 RepID=A0A5J5J2T5_9MICO|nr:hypothetical protein [Microbacterium rhizomatis]KAA9110380.1 hypothetical protein F6B43_01410 [Microbacterium rhizomatis]